MNPVLVPSNMQSDDDTEAIQIQLAKCFVTS